MTTLIDARTTDPRVRTALVRRIRAEYEEMPGLTLTLAQASRLWGEAVRDVEHSLHALVREGFLMRSPTGTYRRTGCPRCS